MNLEDRFREHFTKASEALPGRPLDWTETSARARRARNLYLAAVAFGTAVVLAAGGFGTWAALNARDGGSAPLPPAESAPPAPSPTPADEPEPGVDVSFEGPFRAVDDFIEAAAAGEPETMWGLMTDASRAAYDDDFERFRESALSAIAEGWGSWAAGENVDMHWQVLVSSGDGVMGVVTLMGSRAPEGHEEPFAAAAVPVRVDPEGDARVELFVSEGVIEFVTPRDPSAAQPPALDVVTTVTPTFEALVPRGAGEVAMVAAPVPDEPAVTFSGQVAMEDVGEGRARATWSPEEQLFAGEWFLTVVVIYQDGSMQAHSARFTIE